MAIPVTTKYVNQKDGEAQKIKNKWWSQNKTEMYRHVVGVVNAIDQNQSYRRLKNVQYARLYSNSNFQNFYGVSFDKPQNLGNASNKITLNVVKAVVDTAMAKIAKNKPKPMFLTEKGDYSQQTRAKRLTKYIEGVFYEQDIYKKGQQVFKDAEVFGTGALKIFEDNGNFCIERVMIDEIKVDSSDGMYKEPRCIYQTKYIHRDVLIDMFPNKKDKILTSTGGIDGESSTASSADMIKVIEAWHLPSSKNSTDGKHIVCIESCNLFEEDYKKSYFPFVFLRWSDNIIGFFGTGIPEEIRGIQIEINKLLRSIQTSQHLMSHPKWLVENSSGVNTQHLNNEDGGIIKYTMNAPQAVVPPAMSAEVYNHLENLYQKAFEITGVTQLSATGHKPSGLNSGVALREYNDIESERFVIVAQAYEQMFLEVAEKLIDMSRDIYSKDPDLEVKVKGKKFIQKIKWADVDLDDDKFTMTLFPVSQLPSTPSGKLEYVSELIAGGYVEQEYALDLLELPDIDAYTSNKTANIEILKELIEKMIMDGEYTPPEPFMDLAYNIKFTQRAYLRAKLDNVPEDNLELMRRFIDQNQALINAMNAQMQAQMPQQSLQGVSEQNPLVET